MDCVWCPSTHGMGARLPAVPSEDEVTDQDSLELSLVDSDQGDENSEPHKKRRKFEEIWEGQRDDAACQAVCNPSSCSRYCKLGCWRTVLWTDVQGERENVVKNGDRESKERIYTIVSKNRTKLPQDASVKQHYKVGETLTCRGFFEATFKLRPALITQMAQLAKDKAPKFYNGGGKGKKKRRRQSDSLDGSKRVALVAWLKAVAGDGCQSGQAEYIPHRDIYRLHQMSKAEVFQVRVTAHLV